MIKAQLSKYLMWLLVSMMFSTVSFVNAQSLKINPASSTITIYGTSNLHDWETKVGQINGEFVVNSSKQIQSLVVKIPVSSLKSGEKLMDKKTYEAFDTDKNPTIIFQITEPITPLITDNKDVQVTLTGNLSIASVSKKISFKSTGKITNTGAYQFIASVPLKMTDFKIKPPTALLGTVKAGDAITLKFDVTILAQNML